MATNVEVVTIVNTNNMETVVITFDHQTGGHPGNFLKPSAQKLMKAVSKAEGIFYAGLKDYPELQPFLPQYFGSEEKDGKVYVILEDLTHVFKRPCIMDIKIGTQSYGEDADPAKKQKMQEKDEQTTTVSLGFRITALNVVSEKGELKKRRKSWGRDVTIDLMTQALLEFFPYNRKNLVNAFLAKLYPILAYFEKQKVFRFYSSSLLFLYNANDIDDAPIVEIKMIDFAHVFPINDGGRDEGYLLGIKNLIKYLEDVRSM